MSQISSSLPSTSGTDNNQEQKENSESKRLIISPEEKKRLREEKKKQKQQAKEEKQNLSLSKEERKKQFQEAEEKKKELRKLKESTPSTNNINTNSTTSNNVTSNDNEEYLKLKEEYELLKQQQLNLEKNYNKLQKKYQENRITSHLAEYKPPKSIPINQEGFHPSIIQLGMQYANGLITGCNARTIGLLVALKQVVIDYEISEDKLLSRDFDTKLVKLIDYLKQCRPMSMGMRNALKSFKYSLHHLDKYKELTTQEQRKQKLIEEIETYIEERIDYPERQIVKHGVEKIKDGDVIMTFALSEVIERMIIKASNTKKFTIVVVDSRPKNEGKELVKRLSKAGVKCSLVLINAVTYMMKDVTKVFLGANSVLSNGAVYSRVGTAAVAMLAKAFNVPVLVFCETYKFSEQSQLDSITNNELGDPYELVDLSGIPKRNSSVNYLSSNESGLLEVEGIVATKNAEQKDDQKVYNLENFESIPNLHIINLMYDITPCQHVDMVITEFGAIPPSSVPVIIREFGKD
ncbi:hypothetical protein ABK040_006801 [Willaertia magna]